MPRFTEGAIKLLREAYETGYAARRMDEDEFYDKCEEEFPGLPFEVWVDRASNRLTDIKDLPDGDS